MSNYNLEALKEWWERRERINNDPNPSAEDRKSLESIQSVLVDFKYLAEYSFGKEVGGPRKVLLEGLADHTIDVGDLTVFVAGGMKAIDEWFPATKIEERDNGID